MRKKCAKSCNGDQITCYFLAQKQKGHAGMQEALCMHYQVFCVCFENVYSDWRYEYFLKVYNNPWLFQGKPSSGHVILCAAMLCIKELT